MYTQRLFDLAGCRTVIRHHGIDALLAYREATPAQLAGLHRYEEMFRRLVDAGDPAVLSALWPPEGIDWAVSYPGPTHDLRALAITYRDGPGSGGPGRRSGRRCDPIEAVVSTAVNNPATRRG
jgi:hypothetical protein